MTGREEGVEIENDVWSGKGAMMLEEWCRMVSRLQWWRRENDLIFERLEELVACLR